jgi:ABC-type multidrug transport system fused ATPase/permease subunit
MLQLPRLWLEMLAVVGLAVLVLSMIAQGNDIKSIMPILGLFAAAAFRLMPSVYRMLGALQSLRFVKSIIEILRGELALKTLEQKAARPVGERIDFTRDIRLIDVYFTYPNSARPSLSSLSMCIRHGETVGFIGCSGAGKSTLVDIILGLLRPQGGQIEVDGWDISRGLRDWQDHIGYVPQTIYLTDDTLRRNVAFGFSDEAIDDEAVKRAVRAAQLDDFVMTLPQGLETEVGERGVRLSGGQRQRIGLARALYSDPSVLVLDEATSALDVATEAEVMHAITALHGRKTILIVAHRLSTVENCDRIIRMEGGMISAEGTAAKILGEEQLTT